MTVNMPGDVSSLLQESQFWPLPGHARPTNDSDCMSMSVLCLYKSLRVCLHGGQGLFYEQYSLFFLCAYLMMNSIRVGYFPMWALLLFLDDQ